MKGQMKQQELPTRMQLTQNFPNMTPKKEAFLCVRLMKGQLFQTDLITKFSDITIFYMQFYYKMVYSGQPHLQSYSAVK